jgi:hypothetical protein
MVYGRINQKGILTSHEQDDGIYHPGKEKV